MRSIDLFYKFVLCNKHKYIMMIVIYWGCFWLGVGHDG